MTSPDGATPSGSQTSLASFAQMTEAGAKAPWESAIASLFTFDNLFGGISNAIGSLLGGSFSADGPGAIEAIEHLSAKTQALIDDVSLLNGVPAYGAVYQSYNREFANTAFDPPFENYGYLPFNAPIGPRKNVNILGAGRSDIGGLNGTSPGLWEASVMTYVDISSGVGASSCNMMLSIDVYNVTSGSAVYAFSYRPVVTNSGNGQDPLSLVFTYPFVIPHGHHFNVLVLGAAQATGRKWMGGTKYSGLWLRRISEDVENTSTSATVPDA